MSPALCDRPDPALVAAAAEELLARRRARRDHLAFMDYCWQAPAYPLLVGRHTREIAVELTRAKERLARGESTYLIITVPFRHGKSDLVSRYYPPFILGNIPDAEIILATYGATLSQELSRDSRAIFASDEYARLFPGLALSKASRAVDNWQVEGHRGKVRAIGLEGGATGKGADVLIIDDYFKNREEAESPLMRQKIFDGFCSNLISRLAPAHIVVILATRWHKYDLIGRILERMADDSFPDFPRFKILHYEARTLVGEGEDGQPVYRYLFPERFGESWYRAMFDALGPYAAAALLQGNPTLRGGNLLKVEGVRIEDELPEDLLWVRVWDLASTEDERTGDDPDWTVGAKVAVRLLPGGLERIYVADVRWCRAEAPERDTLIRETAEADGPAVWQGVEAVAGYKDAYTTLKRALKGKSLVYPVHVSRDKVVRAGAIEPHCAAGNLVLAKGWWNGAVLEQLAEFPSGQHDDIVDAIVEGYELARERSRQAGQLGGRLGRGAKAR